MHIILNDYTSNILREAVQSEGGREGGREGERGGREGGREGGTDGREGRMGWHL